MASAFPWVVTVLLGLMVGLGSNVLRLGRIGLWLKMFPEAKVFHRAMAAVNKNLKQKQSLLQ